MDKQQPKTQFTSNADRSSSMAEFAELVPGLPEEISLECLTRLHYSTHRVATRVSRRWRQLIQSRDFYYQRKQSGKTHKVACLVQSFPVHSGSGELKPMGLSYGVTVFDPVSLTWDRLGPVPEYPAGLPLFCQVASSQGKLVVMGGWDPASYSPVSHVFVYDFTTRRWTRGKNMPDNRSFFAAGELNGRVIIAGGHDENKTALSSAWAYDLINDEWTELARMTQERDECEAVVIGSEFWVVSGYKTERQGIFDESAESYQLGTGEWTRAENAWKLSQCPRSNVGVGREGKLFCWAETEAAVQFGTCRVELGGCTLVTGSGYQGGPQEFYVVEGRNGKFRKFDVPAEYKGLVQSGCCVEI